MSNETIIKARSKAPQAVASLRKPVETISAHELARNIGAVLSKVQYRGESIAVTRYNEIVARIVPCLPVELTEDFTWPPREAQLCFCPKLCGFRELVYIVSIVNGLSEIGPKRKPDYIVATANGQIHAGIKLEDLQPAVAHFAIANHGPLWPPISGEPVLCPGWRGGVCTVEAVKESCRTGLPEFEISDGRGCRTKVGIEELKPVQAE